MVRNCTVHAPLGLILGIAFLIIAASPAGAVPGIAVPVSIAQAEQESLQWLLRQMVPNDLVPMPDPGRRRLLLSFRVAPEDPAYRFIYGRSYVYDDALAAVSFTMVGRYREAEFVLNALRHAIRPDGSLWFGYNTQNNWPDEKDHDGAITRTGAAAWVGYAFTYYLTVRNHEAPGFTADDPLGREYLTAARSIASFLLKQEVTKPTDPRHGLLTGGLGASTVTIDTSSRPAEVYSPAAVGWVSTEHNIDSWFFLRDLSRLDPEPRFSAAADGIAKRVLDLWSDSNGQFFQGIHADGTIDAVLPLDGASWGALFLSALGRDAQAARSVASIRRFLVAESHGYRPYGPEPVYADDQVNRFYYPGGVSKLWQDIPLVWGEGSFGAAAAMARSGNGSGALEILSSLRILAVGGGYRYSSMAVPYEFADYPSVASTSWFLIAAEMVRGTPAAELFWGR